MKVTGFVFQPRVDLEFTKAEVDMLRYLAETHYDGTVRSLVPPGRGAVINGLLNSIKDGVADARLSNDQVQLLCKACESSSYLREPKNKALAEKLHDDLYQVIGRLDDEWRRVNPELVA